MKVINIMLEDAEHKKLKEWKRNSTWKIALMIGCDVINNDGKLINTSKENKK